jgi:hypothetical protein
MNIVECSPVLTISQVKALHEWPRLAMTNRLALALTCGEISQVVEIEVTTFSHRTWLSCPRCRSRRRHLHWVGGLVCRRCGKLVYREQSWPDSRWRVQVGRPVLRALRRARAA